MKKHKILFNASVILAGIRSSSGASGVLLKEVRALHIHGVISETILDEAIRHAEKVDMTSETIDHRIRIVFPKIVSAPSVESVELFFALVHDHGDAHLFATAVQEHCGILVSLDKKHILSLKNTYTKIRIVSPGELLRIN